MAKTAEPSVELVATDDAETLAKILAGMQEAETPSKEAAQETRFQIIAGILSAETEDELWKELPTWSSKFVVGESFRIVDAHAFRSKFEGEDGSKGGFLACRAINLATGEQGILNTSAMRLAARIAWYKLNGRLPVKLTVVQKGETDRGFPILDAELVS